MAASGFTPIQLYRTSTASAVPTSGNLADGELAINLTDEILYFKNAAGTVKLLSANITPVANGGTGATAAPAARTNLGATTLGSNLFTITNPGAVTFPRFNADNTVSALDAASFRTAIGAGTGGGSVTSVGGTGTVNGISLSGTVTSSGNLTLGGTLSGVSLTTQVTGTLPVGNGGTGAVSLTANNVLLGNGTSAFQVVAPGASGNVLTSNGTTWQSTALAGGSEIIRVARTSDTTLTSANKGNLIDITSGTFTQTFAAASALGNGWFCYLDNSGTGDITLDPSGSETIDGLTSYIMYPGEVRLVQCDGSTLRTIVLNAFYRTFTASGTFTRPPGYSSFSGMLWGGGGSGGRWANIYICGGGGGGACVPIQIPSPALGATATVTIAAGGAARSTDGFGLTGGTSTFFGFTAFGGGGGGSGANGNFDADASGGGGGGAYGAGGVGVNDAGNTATGGSPHVNDLNSTQANTDNGFGGAQAGRTVGNAIWGGAGGGGGAGSNFARAGGTSLYGGGGGGGGRNNFGAGGVSLVGGNGGAGSDTTAATDGSAPGGGGGGTRSGTSGAGARGELRIWGII